MVLFQNDPFRDFDNVFDRLTRTREGGGPSPMSMDAYRRDNDVWVHMDLPGVAPDSIDIDLERNVLTVSAQREWSLHEDDQLYVTERRTGTFSRQVHLGNGLDAERIEADYRDGVLTLRIPIAETAQPRKISINTGGSKAAAIDAETVEES